MHRTTSCLQMFIFLFIDCYTWLFLSLLWYNCVMPACLIELEGEEINFFSRFSCLRHRSFQNSHKVFHFLLITDKISSRMPCINTDIFVITVHMFLLTTTWCSMMWMDCIHTVLKLKERLVLLKAWRVVSLICISAVCGYFWISILNQLAHST